MGQLKGLYFSLDALLASMILIACATFVIGYIPSTPEHGNPVELDKLHAASIQKVSEWNSSIDSGRTVLGHIYNQHYESPSKVEDICDDYFNFSRPYALYFSNSTAREKACGGYTPGESDSVAVEETLTPDVPVNSAFIGPSNAVMVIDN